MKKLLLMVMPVLFFFILNAQNVGIGINTPETKLHVFTPASGYGITHEANTVRLATFIDAGGAYFGTRDNAPLHFYTNDGLSQISLLTNGNVGIGVSNPQYKMDIMGRMRVKTGAVGNPFTSSGIWFEDYRDGTNRIFLGMQDSIRMGIWGEGTPGANWAFNFNARNGNVGIGIADPVNKLEVNGDVTAQNYKFSTPKTYYYAIPPAAFTPTVINVAGGSGYLSVEHGTSNIYSYNLSNSNDFVAPVNLPDGANITAVTYWGADISATGNMQFSLRRRIHFGNVYEVLNQASSSGNSGDFTLNNPVINYSVIDNNSQNYTLYVVCPGGAEGNYTRIKSVRIAYTMTAPD